MDIYEDEELTESKTIRSKPRTSRPGPNGSRIIGDKDWESCPCCHGIPGESRRKCMRCGGFGRIYNH